MLVVPTQNRQHRNGQTAACKIVDDDFEVIEQEQFTGGNEFDFELLVPLDTLRPEFFFQTVEDFVDSLSKCSQDIAATEPLRRLSLAKIVLENQLNPETRLVMYLISTIANLKLKESKLPAQLAAYRGDQNNATKMERICQAQLKLLNWSQEKPIQIGTIVVKLVQHLLFVQGCESEDFNPDAVTKLAGLVSRVVSVVCDGLAAINKIRIAVSKGCADHRKQAFNTMVESNFPELLSYGFKLNPNSEEQILRISLILTKEISMSLGYQDIIEGRIQKLIDTSADYLQDIDPDLFPLFKDEVRY